jgi:hypothetical protein
MWAPSSTEVTRMTSPGSTTAWLSAAIARAAVVTPQATPRSGRHAAPEVPGVVEIVAAEKLVPGRHAEPEFAREVFDPRRDEDPFDWLGFTA